jgi:hypothetical protein
MKFRYIGEYPEGKQSVECYGVMFTPGAELEVPARCVGKAQGNRFFEEVKDRKPEPEEPRNRLLNAEPDKNALINEAEVKGVKIDKRWNADKIAAAIKDAENGE